MSLYALWGIGDLVQVLDQDRQRQQRRLDGHIDCRAYWGCFEAHSSYDVGEEVKVDCCGGVGTGIGFGNGTKC